jgi:sarcosine oxidase
MPPAKSSKTSSENSFLVNPDKTFDVAIVGAGVFGAWSAYLLRRAGAEVILLDAYGAGNSRSSSGGESRMIRMGYGPDEIYTRMAQRSLMLWQELFQLIGSPGVLPRLFHPTGVLWLARDDDPYCNATLKTLERCQVTYERLDRSELSRRYPQLELGSVTSGILEPDSGVLMARRAVQAIVAEARARGVTYLEEAINSPSPLSGEGVRGRGYAPATPPLPSPLVGRESKLRHDPASEGSKLNSIHTVSGREIAAKQFVFACGPWLPKLFPSLLEELIHVTRQEVFFFGVPVGNASVDRFGPENLPAWIDFTDLVYGIPNLESRGFKVAIDAHGSEFDPDSDDRLASSDGLAAVRSYLAQRMPALANAPVSETRVCQYENTSNGDFLIDRYPGCENLWLVGGGSGHGFKHGPAVGEQVAALIAGGGKVEPRFALATKETVQQRQVY